MARVVVMPKLGLTMTEGTIVEWYKKEGDKIEKGEKLLGVETDKLTNEVEANCSGVLRKIIHSEGTVKVLEEIAIIAEIDEDISELLLESSSENEIKPQIFTKEDRKIEQKTMVNKPSGRVKASPKAKKLAKEMGVDINLVEGTGTQNSITEKDIIDYEKNISKYKISPTAEKLAEKLNVDPSNIGIDKRIMKEDIIKYWNFDKLLEMVDPVETVESISPMRNAISRKMALSQEVSATVSYNLSADTTEMSLLRKKLSSEYKLTYTDIIVKIVSRVLLEHPLLNCSFVDNKIVKRNYSNIGVAVALDEGLIVPVVKYANVKGLRSISKEIKELAFKARNNELSGEELNGGTFTITNLGMYGMESFTPIINQPEVAILGVNTIVKKPVVINDEIVIKPMMTISLTADHRVVDGSVAAQFMKRVKEFIENPSILFL